MYSFLYLVLKELQRERPSIYCGTPLMVVAALAGSDHSQQPAASRLPRGWQGIKELAHLLLLCLYHVHGVRTQGGTLNEMSALQVAGLPQAYF